MDEEPAQILALLKEHSLWITQQLERHYAAAIPFGGAGMVRLLREEKQLSFQQAIRLYESYEFLRHLHFARRTKLKIRPGLFLEMIAGWTPFDWAYNCFPLPTPEVEIVTLGYVVDAMHEEADHYTEWDRTSLGRALHVAHILVSYQGTDGLWPARLNLRTGRNSGVERSHAPRNLMRRLNKILEATEFDNAIACAEEGIAAQKKE